MHGLPFFIAAGAIASAIGPAVVTNSRGHRGGSGTSVGVVQRPQTQPSYSPGGVPLQERGRRAPFPSWTEIFAGDAGGLMRASSPPARAIVTRQGRDADRRLGRSAAQIERGPLGDAPKVRSRSDACRTQCYMYAMTDAEETARAFKTAWFTKAARKARIKDDELCVLDRGSKERPDGRSWC